LALQRVFEARAQLSDSITYERYLRVVEALYAILAPRLRSSRVKELIEKAKRRDPEGFYTSEGVEALDKAVELILDTLDRNHLLMRGEVYEEEHI